MKYGRLTFIKNTQAGKNPKAMYSCECGNVKEINKGNVKKGRTVSCGCRLKETHAPKHGMSNTPTYHTWENMISRCKKGSAQNKNCISSYSNISVCKEWEIFENFYKDMGIKPDKKSIDRINGKMGYFKNNCRWATRKEQQNNLRSNVKINCFGEEMSVSSFISMCGISVGRFYDLKKRGGIGFALREVEKQLGVAAILLELNKSGG